MDAEADNWKAKTPAGVMFHAYSAFFGPKNSREKSDFFLKGHEHVNFFEESRSYILFTISKIEYSLFIMEEMLKKPKPDISIECRFTILNCLY